MKTRLFQDFYSLIWNYLKKIFLTNVKYEKCYQKWEKIFLNVTKYKMTHFSITAAVKDRRESNKQKKWEKVRVKNYSKGRHYTVKKVDMVKFCLVVEFYKNFENLPIKKWFSFFTKVILKLVKPNFRKMRKYHFQRPVYCKEKICVAWIYAGYMHRILRIIFEVSSRHLWTCRIAPNWNSLLTNFAKNSKCRNFTVGWYISFKLSG